jgi:hypothetical protein
MDDRTYGEPVETYVAPELRALGSIEEWTLSGGGTIGISIILP